MAGTGTHDVGASRPSAPVRPPRRVLPPDPATAPDDGGWTTLGSPPTPAQRHRRLDRALWGLVAAVVVAGLAIIGALIASGPSPDVRLPPGTAATDAPLSQRADSPAETRPAPLADGPAPRAGPPDNSHDTPAGHGDGAAGGSAGGRSRTTGSFADDAPSDQSDASGGGALHGHPDDDGSSDTSASPGDPASAPAGWSEVARGFGLAFTRTAVGRDAWFATVSSWLTPEQAALYRDVPIDAIPTGQLTKIDVADPGAASHAHATLTYDTGMVLAVGLSYLPAAGGWLVARVELASATESG